ncbi:MAG: exodeoxyribonuclease V subunit gamma [Xanthomonadales bacterium]|nr:exodeoxyribonuclease V subunit gamma [Xanthomonadales bacterium]
MPTASARFHLISGNRLDRLAAHLGARLAAPADPDSLAPDVVLIPQPALRHWLQQALAERYGVAANLDICTPSEFVWRLLRSAHPQLPDTSPWDRESLRWQLYALLDDSAASLPPAVRLHLQRAAGASAEIGEHALARYGLADALAGAYDKYQAYRRDWLRDWERNDPASRDDWQAQLWRALRQRLRGTSHRAVLLGEWLARHDREADTFAGSAPPGLPPRVAAFGTIHVSPDVLHLLAVVGQWSELDFYLPTPSAEYWGDVESLRERLRRDGVASLPTALADAERDNPLLTAWGAGGREILAQLFSYEIVLPQRETELFALPGRDTLLHRLQQDVLDRAAPATSTFDVDDVSLQLHACHSKLREVEVLHDQLRALLDDARFDPPLQPRDIAVLAPDIADYLPLARAVFGGLSPDDPRFIPFSLADRPQAQSHPLIALLLDLIALADTPLTAGAFRDLLATPSIAHALQLDAAQRAKIDAWFEAAGIRWGEDEAARARVGAGRWREYSFDFGIDRLLSGYATGADTAEIATGAAYIAPYPELEGADADTLDRALTLYRRLRELIAWMRAPHVAADWRARLADMLQTLLAPVPQDDSEAQARRLLLDTLDDFANEAEHAGALPATLVQRTLRDTLTQPSSHRPWLSGGVTFAGMVPLRTVPFRVICLLGLDADAYPRREPGDDINRIVDAIQGRAPRRLGDRSVRDDDRFLFLQLLCAAGDVFYLSYGGRDARDGSIREPSPVIAELLDAVERMHGDTVRERLCVQHPLQPFSPRAFGAGDAGDVEPRRFSYRREWAMPAAAIQTIEPPFVASLMTALDAAQSIPDRDALQRFFVNPARDWLRERLGLRLPDAAHEIADREPLGENGLLRYGAIDALLSHENDEAVESEASESWLRAQALLPPGRDGDAIAHNARMVARDLLAARAAVGGAARPRIVSADTETAVHGIAFRFHDVHDDARAIAVAGRLDGKRRLRAGLDHLLLASALGEPARTHLIGYDSKANAPVEIVYTGLSQAQAEERLAAMLALWREGRDAPLPFAPKTAFAYAAQWHAKTDVGAAWKAAHAAFAPFGGGGESEDMWLRLAFRPEGLLARFDAAHAQRFREIAVVVFDAREPAA